jgi:hypothetical protein
MNAICPTRTSLWNRPALIALLLLPVLPVSGWAATNGYSGQAFGTAVTVAPGGAKITSGTTAPAVLCTFAAGQTKSNGIAGVNLGSLAEVGAITTSISSVSAGGTQSAVATTNVAGINLLGGIIKADGLKAVSTASASASGYSTSATGTMFANLRVLGIPIGLNVSPNTTITLPLIGHVILNEQISTVGANSAQLTVNLVHVAITLKNAFLPIGSALIIGSAEASTVATVSLLSGVAYGTSIAAPPLELGATAAITLPCGGTTNGQVNTNDTIGIALPGIATLGATVTTAQGSVGVSASSAETTASVAGFNLLNGLIKASAVKAAANVSVAGTSVSVSDQGSSFAELTVNGHPEITANPAPNTQVMLAGLGVLYLHRVIQTADSIEVRMLELVVTLDNALGLPIGADVRVADAKTGAVTP